MQTMNEALGLLTVQAELETAMKQELHVVRRRIAQFLEAVRAVVQAAHALRRPVTEVTGGDVESRASAEPAG